MTVYQRIPQGKVLCQTHQGIIHGRITVRMIAAQHRADRIRALAVRLIGCELVLVHGIDDTAVNGLQTVTHIRQRTGDDNGHGIREEAVMHLVRHIDRDDLMLQGFHFC